MNLKLFSSIPTTATARHRLQGIGFMLISTLLWTALELIGGVVPHNYQGLLVVWVRYASHLAFMLIVFGPRYRFDLVRTQALKLQLFRPVFMIGMPLFFLVGLRFMPVTNIWSAFWIAPFMTMILASILLQRTGQYVAMADNVDWPLWSNCNLSAKSGISQLDPYLSTGHGVLFQWLSGTDARAAYGTDANKSFLHCLDRLFTLEPGILLLLATAQFKCFLRNDGHWHPGILVVVLSRQGICACACFCGDTFSLWTTDFHGDPWLFSIWKHSLQHGNSRWCIPDHGPRLLDLV